MVTTRSGQGSPPAAFPSFEEVFNSQQRRPLLTTEAKRLRWVLHGPLETAITVLRQPYHEPGTAPEPYRISQGGPDNPTTWHAVAQAAYTEPKVSSITVSVSQIDDWEDLWRERHIGCADPPLDDEEGGKENYDFPSRCCGEQRPHPQDMTLTIRASGEYVTVHDYVSAVHPWLLRKHEDLLGALGALNDEPRLALPARKHLMVTSGGPDMLSVGTEEEWLLNKEKRMYMYLEEERQKPGPGKGAFVRMAPNGDMGEMPVDKDGYYVELRADDDYGPWPGYVGPWPVPLASPDEVHSAATRHAGTSYEAEGLKMKGDSGNAIQRQVQMTGRARGKFVRMAPNPGMGMMPVDKDGNFFELREFGNFGPWPGHVGPWPIPYTGALTTIGEGYQGARPFGSGPAEQ
ncbi:hypothetical protein GE09DRAFT_288074 [Coniochaeta sp. 2T2.1]|nr:hypothetical protein GE09DRAFT_288074 [Coniochaeta sp. 2T2.1]